MSLIFEEITGRIIGAAVEVHRELGPGLLESSYEKCLCHELQMLKVPFERQKRIPVIYKGIDVGEDDRVDIVAEDKVIVELKAVEKIIPVHEAQLLTYLRLSGKKVGLLINFNEAVLKDGIRRLVL